MSWTDRDHFHRTAKQFVDTGRSENPDNAMQLLGQFVFQVDAREIYAPTTQVALFTMVNTARRAFLGGVRVKLAADCDVTVPWGRGQSVSAVVLQLGGVIVESLDAQFPVVVIGNGGEPTSDVTLHLRWTGWCAGISIVSSDEPIDEHAMPLCGVLAAGLAVSEVFQHLAGSPIAGRRTFGFSLWRPDRDWRDDDAKGPTLQYLPVGLWLLGLGHLGQAYAWTLGFLPYANPADLSVMLLDFDRIVEANVATGLLTTTDDVGDFKTRAAARHMEALGYHTSIVERRYDDHVRPDRFEPTIALAGFDRPEPRRALGDKFDFVVDAGIGGGAHDYLDVLFHTFPSAAHPRAAFAASGVPTRSLPTAYELEIERRIVGGVAEGDARCGMVEIAGASVAASFVGAIAAAVAVAQVLVVLNGGEHFSVMNLDLRDPEHVVCAPKAHPIFLTGFARAK
jgi:hypothetical protein